MTADRHDEQNAALGAALDGYEAEHGAFTDEELAEARQEVPVLGDDGRGVEVTLEEAQAGFEDLVESVARDRSRVIITRDGEPAAALVSHFEWEHARRMAEKFGLAKVLDRPLRGRLGGLPLTDDLMAERALERERDDARMEQWVERVRSRPPLADVSPEQSAAAFDEMRGPWPETEPGEGP